MIMFPLFMAIFAVGIIGGFFSSLICLGERIHWFKKILTCSIPIVLIFWLAAIITSDLPETPKKFVADYQITLVEENGQTVARAVGSDVNFNHKLGVNLKEGDIVKQYKVGYYWHYCVLFVPNEDYIYELVNDK